MSVSLTDKAVAKIQSQLSKDGKPDGCLRLSVSAGGCSGMNYDFAFSAAPEEGDTVFETGGVKLAIAKNALFFINGSKIDWHQSLMEAGFRVANPNATAACNCGTSFTAEAEPAVSGADLF